MRFWRRTPKFIAPAFPTDGLLAIEAELRQRVEDLLVIDERLFRGRAVSYGGQLLVSPGSALSILIPRLSPFGYTPFLKEERGKSWVHAFPIGEVTVKTNLPLHIGLFLATVLTTLFAGALFNGVNPLTDPGRLLYGIPFAFTLLAILGTHEFGHYFTARYHGTAVTLPYFIPAPPPFLAGTLGALIRMKSPVKNRNALFDIAVAGPLAGLVVAIPALIWGLALSRQVRVRDQVHGLLFGDSLLVKAISYLVLGPLPDHVDILIHPIGLAGWFGLFVTALNLIPAGQLDGGHIAYALFGRRHRQVSIATVLALLALGFFSVNWLVWAALILFLMGLQHSPPLDDITPISPGRRVLGYFALLLLISLIPPNPLQLQ